MEGGTTANPAGSAQPDHGGSGGPEARRSEAEFQHRRMVSQHSMYQVANLAESLPMDQAHPG